MTVRAEAAPLAAPLKVVARRPKDRKKAVKPRDIVVYSGGQSGTLYVIKAGAVTYRTRAVSGHSDHEWEKGVGPIPTGSYALHPKRTGPTVAKPQGGVCSAGPLDTGYQEITSDDPQKCAKPNHYCTLDCSAGFGAGATCYTPRSCWGSRRLKIEGSATVAKPGGGTVTRNGFYIHGGDHSVAMTSGCVKVFDDAVFDSIRDLSDEVPMCVGTACPAWATSAAGASDVAALVDEVADTLSDIF